MSEVDDARAKVDAQMAIINYIKEMYPDYYDSTMGQLGAYTGWKDKELAQTLRIANQTSRNSRYSTDMNYKANQMQDKTTRRGQDIQQENNYMTNALRAREIASGLRGAKHTFQAIQFNDGSSDMNGMPTFIQNALNGRGGAAFTGPAGNPQGVNMGNLMSNLGMSGTPQGGGNGQITGQAGQALAGIRQINSQGLHSLAPGTLESWSPDKLGAFQSGTEYGGDGGPAWNWDSQIFDYQVSRPGQGSTRAA